MVIGIGGVSNAGKSTLARNLKSIFTKEKVISLCQDDFAFPTNQIPKINSHTDWESPKSIDFLRYRDEAIKKIALYDIVILEGIFAFHDPVLNKLMDIKFILTLNKETFLKRKREDHRWGKEPDWYVEHIWESHIQYCLQHPVKNLVLLNASNSINTEEIVNKYLQPAGMLKKT